MVVIALVRVGGRVAEDERTRKAALRRQNLRTSSQFSLLGPNGDRDIHDGWKHREGGCDLKMFKLVGSKFQLEWPKFFS